MAWSEYLNAVTGVLTAAFTGWGAYLVWSQQRDKITFEWNEEYSSETNSIVVRCTLRNHTGATLNAFRVDVSGKVKGVETGRDSKHESWAAQSAPLRCTPEPGKEGSFSFTVLPDWAALKVQTDRWHSRFRTWIAQHAWQSFSVRVHHGASLHFQITIDSRSNKRFRRRIKDTIFISPQTIERKLAKTINQSTETPPLPV